MLTMILTYASFFDTVVLPLRICVLGEVLPLTGEELSPR